jgi:molybdate transport repressor ModE-like protein
MKMKVKLWLESEKGLGLFGHGRYQLLRAVGETGSLQGAARTTGISYRKAWGDIREMEQRLGKELVRRSRGGKGGGVSELTEFGRQLLEAYEKTLKRVQEFTQVEFQKQFTFLWKNALSEDD